MPNVIAEKKTSSFAEEVHDFYVTNGFKGSDDELHSYINLVLGYNIPRVGVCKDHRGPFDFVADNFFERKGIRNTLSFGCRTGGKTLNLAILNILDLFFKPACEIVEVGAILAQAQRCYRYVEDFLSTKHLFKDVTKITQGETRLRNRSMLQV
ncbi:hypothetical protein LCGC14_2892400, partial [marine sediment metagenome]